MMSEEALLYELDAERDSILQAASVTLLPNSFRRPGGWLGFLGEIPNFRFWLNPKFRRGTFGKVPRIGF